MATVRELERQVDSIIADLSNKVDKDTLRLELELLKKDIKSSMDANHSTDNQIRRIDGYAKWFVLLVMAGIVGAVFRVILK